MSRIIHLKDKKEKLKKKLSWNVRKKICALKMSHQRTNFFRYLCAYTRSSVIKKNFKILNGRNSKNTV